MILTENARIARRYGFSHEGCANGCDVYRLRCEKEKRQAFFKKACLF